MLVSCIREQSAQIIIFSFQLNYANKVTVARCFLAGTGFIPVRTETQGTIYNAIMFYITK